MEATHNKQLVQELFDATARGEWRPFADALADDVRYTLLGHNSWAGTYEGRQAAIRDLWGAIMKKLAAPNRIRAHRIVADGDVVVVEARGDATTVSGQRYANDYCLVFRLRDGKIVEATEYMDTELTTEVMGAREL
jgi:ketosteroid isomerase-like protein